MCKLFLLFALYLCSSVSSIPCPNSFFSFWKRWYSSIRMLECLLWYKCWVGALFSFGALPCWCHLKVAVCHNYAFIVTSCKWFISLSVQQQSVCLSVCLSVGPSIRLCFFRQTLSVAWGRQGIVVTQQPIVFSLSSYFYRLTAYRFYRTRYAAPEKPLTSKSRNLWLGVYSLVLLQHAPSSSLVPSNNLP